MARCPKVARNILSQGDRVVATARRADQIRTQVPDAGDALLSVDLDVTNADQVTQAVKAAIDNRPTTTSPAPSLNSARNSGECFAVSAGSATAPSWL
ncbi:hypothetical protein MSIMFB_01130 [Mycobacterium simulans]|uniref:Uncharacterized protein n=1 Tax=Mycobacterium simulans TaxID=627089 RepID=A0A7Z7IHH2_9MYCO|nr:hypothetical protein [Mycobacterium simulans]SOJ53631.1 hypothetical protein MSIMFB_01130 [Mycobacterium simulans]